MIKFIRGLAVSLGLFFSFAITCVSVTAATLPDSFNVRRGDALRFDSILPVKAAPSYTSAYTQTSSSKNSGGSFILKVFGIFPAKEVTVNPIDTTYVIPGGEAFGVKLYSKGVMVIGFSDFSSGTSPAYKSGIRAGDMIMTLNGIDVSSNEEVAEIISNCGGSVEAKIIRNGKEKRLTIIPEKDSMGLYKSGMWVRDSTAGIGTVSYYLPDSRIFAGLGHGITDTDTGEIFPLQAGEAVGAYISSVNKGAKGAPGELCGSLNNTVLGTLFGNTECGVFGVSENAPVGTPIPVAMKQEAKRGSAYIRCTLEGNEVKEYSAEIVSIDYNSNAATKNMVIRITDSELLSKTGGIVRGMSGSPIIQDGKLIGAVTHVFVDDPTSGYAIFAENMLSMSDTLLDSAA